MILTPKELQKWLDKGKSFRVVDIRTEEQREMDSVVGLKTRIATEDELDLTTMDGKLVVLICHYGLITEQLIGE